MNSHHRVTVVRKEGVSITGRVIDNTGKLGRYEVFSDYWGSSGTVYHQFSTAEARMNELVDRTKKKESGK